MGKYEFVCKPSELFFREEQIDYYLGKYEYIAFNILGIINTMDLHDSNKLNYHFHIEFTPCMKMEHNWKDNILLDSNFELVNSKVLESYSLLGDRDFSEIYEIELQEEGEIWIK